MTGPDSTLGRRGFLRWLAVGAVAVAATFVPTVADRGGPVTRVAPGGALPKNTPNPREGHATPDAPPATARHAPGEVADGQVSPTQQSVGRLEVICREATGLVPASEDARAHTIALLTLHHTAVRLDDPRRVPARLRGHQAFHRQQGWSDIAYHHGVDPEGNVYELRAPDVPGDTFTDYDPTGHLLVVCEGDYSVDEPTDTMLDALSGLFAYASAHFGVSLATLAGHRDHAATRCPGDHLADRLDEIRDRAARRTAPVLVRVCGPDGAERIRSIEVG